MILYDISLRNFNGKPLHFSQRELIWYFPYDCSVWFVKRFDFQILHLYVILYDISLRKFNRKSMYFSQSELIWYLIHKTKLDLRVGSLPKLIFFYLFILFENDFYVSVVQESSNFPCTLLINVRSSIKMRIFFRPFNNKKKEELLFS